MMKLLKAILVILAVILDQTKSWKAWLHEILINRDLVVVEPEKAIALDFLLFFLNLDQL